MKKLNTAQSLLANIALKTKELPMFDGQVLVKQWKASERLKYIELITAAAEESDELLQILPQAQIVAMSLVNDKGSPLFDFKWDDKTNKPVFSDSDAIDTIVENRANEASEAFLLIAKFNGLYLGDDEEEAAAKN